MRAFFGFRVLAAAISLLGATLAGLGAARAHPHVLIGVRTTVVVNEAGEISALKHRWTFDEAISSYYTMGLDTNGDGKFSREELSELAKVNVESLKEADSYTVLQVLKDRALFGAARDYWLEHDGKRLILNFTLPIEGKGPEIAKAKLEVYDPQFYIAFDFEKENGVTVEGGKPGCTASISTANAGVTERLSKLGESFFQSMGSNTTAEWSAPVRFKCP